jgi:peptide/nickel transport system substrate-binding protein
MSILRLIACLMMAVTMCLATAPSRADSKVLRVVPHADLTQLDPVFASIVITRE